MLLGEQGQIITAVLAIRVIHVSSDRELNIKHTHTHYKIHKITLSFRLPTL